MEDETYGVPSMAEY